jgi:hypothetical protein
MTWFKRDTGLQWYHPEQVQQVLGYCKNTMAGHR